MSDIVYLFEDQVYLNITNACPCNCKFCIRTHGDGLGSAEQLWLERAPSLEEIKAAIDAFDFGGREAVVFCGYGEPTCAFSNLVETSRYIKEKYGYKIRVNTNGLSDLINGRPTAKEFCKYIDVASISLNAPTAESYNELVRPSFGERSFEAMLQFAKECKTYGVEVKFSVVDVISAEEIAACQRLSDEMGIPLRVRTYSE